MASRKNYKGLLKGSGLLIALLILFLLSFLVYSFNKFYSNKKTILDKQKILFSKLGINSSINYDGTIITTDPTITEELFQKVSFVTNNKELYQEPMNLISISVLLDEKAISIPGFFQWIKNKIAMSDKIAFNKREDIHRPFNEINIKKVIEKILGYVVIKKITFQLILDPPAKIINKDQFKDKNGSICLKTQVKKNDQLCCPPFVNLGCDDICGSNIVLHIKNKKNPYDRVWIPATPNTIYNEKQICCTKNKVSDTGVCCDKENNFLDGQRVCCDKSNVVNNSCYFKNQSKATKIPASKPAELAIVNNGSYNSAPGSNMEDVRNMHPVGRFFWALGAAR